MAIIRPFKAIRPARDKANLVASRSYLTYSDETIKEKLNHNPYTFLHIINPDYNTSTKVTGVAKFKLVKEKFNQFINDGILKKDKVESYYIYQKNNQLNTFTGIIGAASVKDYLNNKIKKHEHTLTKREKMFRNYLDATGFNAEPILLSHEPNNEIKNILDKYTNTRSEYEFTTTNKSLHKLWLIHETSDIKTITNAFKKIENLYIADGHHRCASSALLSKNKKSELSNYFMSYLIYENQLNILNFNRLVKHLNGLTASELLDKIKEKYTVTHKKENIYSPTLKGEISMYLNSTWYSLIATQQEYTSTATNLGPSILSKNILGPLLNIIDERTDKNISFLDGTIPLTEIKNKVDNGEYAVAFMLKPISITAIKKVADNNEIMPPKSTYVEPKLRSGLTIYPIE
ncbi:MAG: DUF1015 domain-containing protein [Bacteroidota bacterium]|nr:DUF1015 domain-containing protein [Bacteroidota bacterium]